VKHIRNETNLGHIRNFNKGIRMATGKYVWLISADDLLRSPDVLAQFVDLMERNPDIGYTFCRSIEFQDGKERGVARFDYGNEDRVWDGPAFLARLVRCNCIALSSGMVRRECYDKVGLFPLDMPHAGDWYLWCVLALHGRVAYFSEPMVLCRVHDQSLTNALNREEAAICLIDELNVLWRVRQQAELAGIFSLRSTCNQSLGRRAARALHSGPAGGEYPGLSRTDFEAILKSHVTDANDEEDIRALVYTSLGDEQYWHGEYREAARSYWLGLKLRPRRLKTWTKYALLGTGGFGFFIRRFVYQLRNATAGSLWTRRLDRIPRAKHTTLS
jgi:glycosyltransferase involved in cell wall biosynthesis